MTLTPKTAERLAKLMPPAIRHHRYRVWREKGLLAKELIDIIEQHYPPGENPLPSAQAMATNASLALARTARQIMRGKPVVVSEEEKQRRLGLCKECQWYRFSDDRCSHKKCGCFLKIKTRLKAEKCPDNRW